MMHSEFCEISGQQVSYKVYAEKFEPMYLALDVDKREFIEFMMPVIKAVAKQEKMDREAEERKQQKLVFVSDGSKTPEWLLLLRKVLQADRLRHPYWKGPCPRTD